MPSNTNEEFKEKLTQVVRSHYAADRTPLLLARLGTLLDKEDAWPADRGTRTLKQLITQIASPDVDVVSDRRSPSYIAVVTPDVRESVSEQMERKLGTRANSVRLENLLRSVLLAFCIDSRGEPVYVQRSRPFRYEVGRLAPDQAPQFVLVEPEYRRPGLRVDRVQSLGPNDKLDLAGRIQRWATVHELPIEQFYKQEASEKQAVDTASTALDRLLNAQQAEVAQKLMIPADIAQILARLR